MPLGSDFRIAVLPGDGIGIEVMNACLEVLEALAGKSGQPRFAWHQLAGGAIAYRDTGTALSEETMKALGSADAILFGAMGMPDIRYPDGTEIAPQLDIRIEYELYAGVRPIRALPGAAGPLRDPRSAQIDFVILREQTEGLYYSRGRGVMQDADTALNLLLKPWDFDVIVTENMFGDILSDLAAGLIGGMGFAPSGDIGERHGMFQPCHGTAPDIAGTGKANPTAMFLSAAMMLDWLGDQHGVERLAEAAKMLEDAVRNAFSRKSLRPFEFGGSDGTVAITRAVLAELTSV